MARHLRDFLRRHPRSTVVAVLTVLFGSWLMYAVLASRLSPAAVDRTLSALVHLDVQTESVRLSWGGQITLHHVVVRSQGESLLTAPSAKVQIALTDLLRGELQAQSVTLEKPDLTMNLRQWQDWSLRLQAAPLPGTIPIVIHQGHCTYALANGRSVLFDQVAGQVSLCAGNITGEAAFSDDLGDRYHVNLALHIPQVSVKGLMMQPSMAELARAFQAPAVPGLDVAASMRFSLQGQLPALSLDAQAQLGALAMHVQGLIQATSAASFEGVVDAHGGVLPGVGPVTSLHLPLRVSESGLRVTSALLAVAAGTLRLDADLPTVGPAAVSLTSPAFNPSHLTCLEGSGLWTSAGPFKLEAKGPLSNLAIRVTALQSGSKTLRNAHLDGRALLTSRGLQLTALSLGLGGHGMRVTGFVRWLDPKNLTAQISGLDMSVLGLLFNEPVEGVMSATVSYEPATLRLRVQASVPAGMVAGEPVEALHISLDGTRTGAATLTGRWRQKQHAAILSVARTANGQFTFSLSGAAWHGQTLPAVEGEGALQGDKALAVAHVTGLSPPLDVAVQVQVPPRTFSATTIFKGQSVAAASPFLPATVPPVQGHVYGLLTVTGPPMSVHFEGDVKAFDMAGFSTENVHIAVTQGTGGVTRIAVDAPQSKWRTRALGAATGRMELRHTRLSIQTMAVTDPPLSMTGLVDLATSHLHLQAPLSGMEVKRLVPSEVRGTLTGLVTVDGTVDHPVLAYIGQATDVAGLTGAVRLSVHPSGADSLSGTWHLGQGTLNGQALPAMGGGMSGNSRQISVGGTFAVQDLSLVAGLAGLVTFKATFPPSSPVEATVEGSLTGATRNGRPFPALQAYGRYSTAGHVQLSSLSAASLGLNLSGAIDMQQQTLALSGSLQNARLQDLISVAGSPSADTTGVVSGSLQVQGSLRSPRIQFTGRIADMTWQSKALGAGRLSLTATPSTVNGTLVLDRRAGLTSGSFLSHIPGLAAVTNAVVDITGATISGSPQKPHIQPTVQALRGFQRR